MPHHQSARSRRLGAELLHAQAARSSTSRANARPDRWMTGPGA
ncbi:hypothetical protein [Streptomyces yangpuensis]